MDEPLQVNGMDIPLTALTPLRERESLNTKTNRGYRRICSSIRTIGLIEPLSVYPEGDTYVILDGYLRYRAFQELNILIAPCIVYQTKEAYTFNRMVNQLSCSQEVRMLRKALETVDEKTIADVFGVKDLHDRLARKVLAMLHPKAKEAFDQDLLSRKAAKELVDAKPERQVEMLKEMKRVQDYTPNFIRALILKTPPEMRNPDRTSRSSWSTNSNKRKEIVSRLQEAEKQQDFYTKLYRQYTADLMKMTLYVRKIVNTPALTAYLKEHHAATLNELTQIVMETPQAQT